MREHIRDQIMEQRYFGNEKWDRRFMGMAHEVAKWSKDPSTKVGAVAMRGRRQIATGYNGFPAGVDDSEERYENRSLKHLLTVHAEANLVAQAASEGVSLGGSVVYVTHPCCSQCAALLAQAGVLRVVYGGKLRPDWRDSTEAAELIFSETDVTYHHIDDKGGWTDDDVSF